MSQRSRAVAIALFAVLVLAGLYLVRPVLHGLAMFFYVYPLLWLPPATILAAALLFLGRFRSNPTGLAGRSSDPRFDPTQPRRRRWPMGRSPADQLRARGKGPPAVAFLVLAGVSFVMGALFNAPLTGRAIYNSTRYEEIPGLPPGGTVRLLPKDVAVEIASSGFNSPTEHLTDFHIVKTPRGLAWTALRTPDGAVRTFTKKSEGLVSLDASTTERRVRPADARFETAPGLQITDNLRWRLLKRRYLIELAEPAAMLDAAGRPIIVVPYLEYRGLLVRRPVLGGVFVVRPNGDIEDLSPEEARQRPEIAASGRLFPDTLARRIQDAYTYKRGIWNRFFVHEEQTQITDTETNQQPYLIDFGPRGSKWVTVAEPYGRAFAVNAIFLTDAATGATQVWRVPREQSLSGNRRAIQTVRSVSIPGVVFAGDDARAPGGGRFRVVEPRPVFVDGRLVYLVSIVPESANSVSKSVIVDAARNKVVAIFDNDTDPAADENTLRYLATGKLPEGSAPGDGAAEEPPDQRAGEPVPGAAGERDGRPPSRPVTGPELERRLDRLIRRQREILREAESLRDALPESRDQR